MSRQKFNGFVGMVSKINLIEVSLYFHANKIYFWLVRKSQQFKLNNKATSGGTKITSSKMRLKAALLHNPGALKSTRSYATENVNITKANQYTTLWLTKTYLFQISCK